MKRRFIAHYPSLRCQMTTRCLNGAYSFQTDTAVCREAALPNPLIPGAIPSGLISMKLKNSILRWNRKRRKPRKRFGKNIKKGRKL